MVPETVNQVFREAYGGEPSIVASAPGRVNLIGEHLDYNGGEVLPMAIGKRTWIAMRRSDAPASRAVSATEEDTGEFMSPDPTRSGRWWDYVAGLGSMPGRALPTVDLAVTSDVPAGAGLSSSAALEVAAGAAYSAIEGKEIDMRSIALDAWRVESEFVGVDVGIMDQFASALAREGHALHIDCETTITTHVPFTRTVLIFDTAAPRSLRGSEFNTRRAECAEALMLVRKAHPETPNLAHATEDVVRSAALPETLHRRAMHVVTEMQRVQTAVKQLRDGGTIAPILLYESHASLRDMYQCSSEELDWFVDRAMRLDGIEGARLTGAGWGGCAIAMGNREALAAAGDEIARDYESRFGRRPGVWLTEAGAGARVDAG